MFKLDKTYSKAHTFRDPACRPGRADNNLEYWKSKTVEERLSAAWYLTCMAYGLDPNENHRLDRTVVTMRKHPDSE